MTTSPIDQFLVNEQPRIFAFIELVLPDEAIRPDGREGGLEFLRRVLKERRDWQPKIANALEQADRAALAYGGKPLAGLGGDDRAQAVSATAEDPDFSWLCQLLNAGYYADPGNGWNTDGRSWREMGWTPAPSGGWPTTDEYRPPKEALIGPAALQERYDAVVIGTGAGGGVAACGLAEAGRRVLVVESGTWPMTAFLAADHLRNPRSTWGLAPRSGPPFHGFPRVFDGGSQRMIVQPPDRQWSGNAMTAGGGTRVYGAQAWRFGPTDFKMATTYGTPGGSALADWPFGYKELEPYYVRAEWEIGVSGGPSDGAYSGPRSRPLPMRQLPGGFDARLLATGAERLGINTVGVPLLVNSEPYSGRQACVQCGMCVGFACPVNAKNGSQNTMLARAVATGACSIILEATADRLIVDSRGVVTGVALVGAKDGRTWRAHVSAGEFVVAGGAVETPRLLLNSRSERESEGIGNNADQVGRYLQAHVYGGAIGFAPSGGELRGPGPAIATGDFRQGNRGIIGGGILVNDFVNTPSNLYRYLSDAGLVQTFGAASMKEMRELSQRFVKVSGPIQEMTSAGSRVRVDGSVRDRLGIPVAHLSGGLHEEDIRARDFLADRAAEWLSASGIQPVASMPRSVPEGPSGGQHAAGTCRMGNDPSTSVTDPWGRVWGHHNLRIADGSVHVTNGGVNPVLTIFANAFRIIDHMTGGEWAPR